MTMTPEIVITVGIPGCGKSSLVNNGWTSAVYGRLVRVEA